MELVFVYIFYMFDSKKKRHVEAKEICFCRLCGAEIVQLRHANGHPYWTNVCFELRSHGRYIVLGEGNNFNFKPEHDCVKQAELDFARAEREYNEFVAKHTAAVNTLAQVEQAEKETAQTHADDQQLLDTFKRIYAGARENLKMLDAQKPSQDDYITGLRTRLELLRQGKSVIAADKPAVGRTAKVIKGRKVPVGTQGVIFWMGIDQYKEDSYRVGIEANGQKHYTSTDNIEVIQS